MQARGRETKIRGYTDNTSLSDTAVLSAPTLEGLILSLRVVLN